MYASAQRIRISPKKVNVVASMVRKRDVKEALEILKFTPKKAAAILFKVIKSAASNAQNNFKQDIDKLYIEEIIVNQGQTLRRSVPISRGRMHPIRKTSAHIRVKVAVRQQTPAAKPTLKKEEPKKQPEKNTSEAKPTVSKVEKQPAKKHPSANKTEPAAS